MPLKTPTISKISTDTGATSTDGVTTDRTLVLSGLADPYTLMQVFRDGVLIGSATASSTGAWSFDYGASVSLADGTYAFTARATDSLGNTSALSSVFQVTVDNVAPAQPTVTGFGTESGFVGSGGATRDGTLVVMGTAEANTRVEVRLGSTVLGRTVSDANGNWTFDYSGTALKDGQYSFSAKAIDLAGNSRASTSATITVDTIASTPTISKISTDSGASSTDGVTTDRTLVLSGVADPSALVQVFRGGVLIGSATASSTGAWSFDYGAGTSLADGTYAFTARATDPLGNTSSLSSVFQVTVDNIAPAQPTVTGFGTENGFVASGGTTGDGTLVVIGTAEANTRVEVRLGSTVLGKTVSDASGNWTFDYSGTALKDGQYSFSAKAIDLAGNSRASASATITVDAIASTPTISKISTDSGASSTDGVTVDRTLVLSGLSDPSAFVQVFRDSVLVGSVTASSTGAWSFDYGASTSLADGTYAFTAKATDPLGNTSALSSVCQVTVDNIAPAQPTVTGFGTEAGFVANGGATRDGTLVVIGTAEANTRVEVRLGTTVLGRTVTDASGNWSFDYSGTVLNDGLYNFTAKAIDLAGNSKSSASATITVDATDGDRPRTSFAVVGDYGVDNINEKTVADLIKFHTPDFIVSAGDNIDDPGMTYDQTVGKYYHEYIGNYKGQYGTGSATNRFFASLGDNDYQTGHSDDYLDYFTLPGSGSSTSGNERYYDFVQGPVHFFVLNSNKEEPDGISSQSAQAMWLKGALANSDMPWKIVVFHHPPSDTATMNWPFEDWGASAVLNGHRHQYERILRDDNGDGVMMPYLTNGLGGDSRNSYTPAPGSQFQYSGNYGAMFVHATDTDLQFEFWSVTNGGTLLDSYALERGSSSDAATVSSLSSTNPALHAYEFTL